MTASSASDALLSRAEKLELVTMLLAAGSLRFGSYKTKSGRESPYFINFGDLGRGKWLAGMGGFLAKALMGNGYCDAASSTFLFGPAYKGIALALAAAVQVWEKHGIDLPFVFNRKEEKAHGEKGLLIGPEPSADSRILILDDVLTGGTSARQCLDILRARGLKAEGLMVVVDRQESGQTSKLAAEELQDEYGLKLRSLLSMDDIVELCYAQEVAGKVWIDDAMMQAIADYRRRYGKI